MGVIGLSLGSGSSPPASLGSRVPTSGRWGQIPNPHRSAGGLLPGEGASRWPLPLTDSQAAWHSLVLSSTGWAELLDADTSWPLHHICPSGVLPYGVAQSGPSA